MGYLWQFRIPESPKYNAILQKLTPRISVSFHEASEKKIKEKLWRLKTKIFILKWRYCHTFRGIVIPEIQISMTVYSGRKTPLEF